MCSIANFENIPEYSSSNKKPKYIRVKNASHPYVVGKHVKKEIF